MARHFTRALAARRARADAGAGLLSPRNSGACALPKNSLFPALPQGGLGECAQALKTAAARVSPGSAQRLVGEMLALADIAVGGNRPWDIAVHDARFYDRLLAEGSIGLGESYMDGWWDADSLDEFFFRALRVRLDARLPRDLGTLLSVAKSRLCNLQTRKLSRRVAEVHYDLGNDFYEAMLDPFMQYTCAYFKKGDDLALAQERKLDLICRKLRLKPGERVLDLGCGFGGFAKFAAERHGCQVTGVNISTEQVKYAREFCQGLPVEILECDYRDAAGNYDKIVSIGMTEHVGEKNYRDLMLTARRCLKPDGLFLLHTIGKSDLAMAGDPWLLKHIFPGAMIPSVTHLARALDGTFVIEDWHNFGACYDPTVMAWRENFLRGWPAFRARYGERFKRMWHYYLSACAGNFRARTAQLWQLVLSPQGQVGGYASAR